MKKRLFACLLVLILSLALCAPALASVEYDLAYDATGKLDAVFINEYGKTLSMLSEQYAAELRVDIVTDSEGYSLAEYAAIFHDNYFYGYPGTGDGVLLMLLVTDSGDGVAVEDCTVISYGENSLLDGAGQYLEDNLYLSSALQPESWAGGLEGDLNSLMNLLSNYASGMAVFLAQSAAAGGGSGWQGGEAGLDYVTDNAGILTAEEELALEQYAAAVSEAYGCGVYIVTVNDYTYYSATGVREAAEDIYRDNSLGLGTDKSGELLLMSMNDRDYAIIAYGYGNDVFTDRGKTWLEDNFLDNFRDNDWSGGFYDYIQYSAQLLEEVRLGYGQGGGEVNPGGEVVRRDPAERALFRITENLGIILGVPLLIAIIVCFILWRSMKSVAKRASALEYVTSEGLDLRLRSDNFTHTTQTRVRIKSESSGHGGGGTSIGSSGFSGHSGKF